MAAFLWLIIAVLAVLWLVGFVLVHVASPLIHLLLIVALILIVWNLFAAPRQSV
jgi:hypothetical protein